MKDSVVVGAALLCALASCSAIAQEFTVVVLPDTQNYVDINKPPANLPNFAAQTDWIVGEVLGDNDRNIVFVTHVGDVVQRGNRLTEWERADDAMSRLDSVVPYSLLPGNHDWNVTGDKQSGIQNYLDTFGPQRFDRERWFGGSSPNGLNSYQVIEVEGFTFLHLAIEWAPPSIGGGAGTALAWAQSILDQYPTTPTILSTHEYVDNSPAGREENGDRIWNELIRSNNQVFLVLCGHICNGPTGVPRGLYHQTSTNDAGNPVHEVLQDFQCLSNGGDAYLRLIEIDAEAGVINFETYSPVLDQFQANTVAEDGPFAAQMTLPIDFDSRFACSPEDLNTDGVLDGLDAFAFLPVFLTGEREADLNRDRETDFFDLLLFLERVDAGCP